MVVGFGCTQEPATGGEIVGVVDPSTTGEEKVMLMSALEAVFDAPEEGLVETIESGVTADFPVVCVVPPAPALFEPWDLPMPYATAAAAATSTTTPAIKSHARPRRGAFPCASRTCIP